MGGWLQILFPPSRVNPEPGGGEWKEEAVRKVVKMYVLVGLGDASDHHEVLRSLFRLSSDQGWEFG